MSSVIVLKTREHEVEKNVNKIFELAGGINKFVKKGDRVLIKPNFLNSKPSSTGCTTDLRIVEAVVRLVLKQKAVPIIGEGAPISFDTEQSYKRLGVKKLAERYKVRLVDLNKYAFKKVKLKNALVLNEARISKLVFEVDKIINLPVMKTHVLTTVSLGMKNMMGCLSGDEKIELHRRGICEGIVDLCRIKKPDFTIIDGIVAMEGAGPTNGKPKKMNLLIGSEDVLAADIIASSIMGFNPYSLKFIRLAQGKGIGEHDIKRLRVIGARLKDVRRKFSFPLVNIRKLLGTVLLKRIIPVLKGMGVDINEFARQVYEALRPYPVFLEHCKQCKRCVINCPEKALVLQGTNKPLLHKKKCIKCYVCDEVCLYGAVKIKGSR